MPIDKDPKPERAARLAKALRENLKRRKAAQRKQAGPDKRPPDPGKPR